MSDKITCACGCGHNVTFPTQRNHCERWTGDHGLRAQLAEEQQDLQHAFLEGLTRKRRQEEEMKAHSRKRRRRCGRGGDNAEASSGPATDLTQEESLRDRNHPPTQAAPSAPQHESNNSNLDCASLITEPGSGLHANDPPLLSPQPPDDNEPPSESLTQDLLHPALAEARGRIAEAQIQRVSQLRWVRRHRQEDSVEEVEELMPEGDDEEGGEEEEERGRALPGEITLGDLPPLMEVSDDEDNEDNDNMDDDTDERWDDETSLAGQGGDVLVAISAPAPPPLTPDEDEQAAATYFREQFERDSARASTLGAYVTQIILHMVLTPP